MVKLDGVSLSCSDVERVAVGSEPVELDLDALAAVARNRASLQEAIDRGDPIYGITTGVGAFVTTAVDLADAAQMQRNILRSHAAGVGPLLPRAAVRAALVIRLNCLLRARSGVRTVLLEWLAAFLNAGIVPAVPSTGSVGASGDLAPSAHAFLPLIGEGEVLAADGARRPATEALAEHGIEPLELAPKEALALINGTHFMAGLGALAVRRARRLAASADGTAALTIEALRGASAAYREDVHELRALAGQRRVAATIRALIKGSERTGSTPRLQDAYSLRCAPQVHGACHEAVDFVTGLIEVDLNAVTDNPIVFDDPLEVVSAGNFHGQSLAMALDLLRIAVTDLASIAERRTFRLLSPSLNGDLPDFLALIPGRDNGYMLTQITAAALVAELRALAHPTSIDSVPTSDNQEDHVSMGMTSALLAGQVLDRADAVVAIEALCAAQAIEVTPGDPGAGSQRLVAQIRDRVPRLVEDRPPAPDVEAARELVAEGRLARIVGEV